MKKPWLFALTLAVLLGMAGCGVEDSQPTPEPTPSATVEPIPTPTPTPTPMPTAEDIFPREFCLTSGVGGWSTYIDITADGSFSGDYHVWDWDHMTDDDPLYQDSFTGQFSKPEQVNEYTYSMKLEQLEVDLDLLGLGGEEFLVYLPGAPLDELPEEFVLWVKAPWSIKEEDTVLPCYGLYNVNEQCGFFEAW